jgi:transcriptional regulator with XRE-family HTH domain
MAKTEKTHPLYLWRKENGVTLQALANRLDVSQPHLSEIENWNNDPSLDLASRLHAHTGIDMKAFVRPQEKAGCQ